LKIHFTSANASIAPSLGYYTYLVAITCTGLYTGALKETEAFSWWKIFNPTKRRKYGHEHGNQGNSRCRSRGHGLFHASFDRSDYHGNTGRIPIAMAMNSSNKSSIGSSASSSTASSISAASVNSNENVSTQSREFILIDPSEDASAGTQNDFGNHDNDIEPAKLATTGMKKNETTLVYTFHCPAYNTTLHSHGISLLQFKAWVQYKLKQQSIDFTDQKEFDTLNMMQYVTSKRIHASDTFVRHRLRKEWFAGRLIVDRTEVLIKYPSDDGDGDGDDHGDDDNSKNNYEEELESESSNDGGAIEMDGGGQRKKQRGGFEDLLLGYVGRLVDILKDEMKDGSDQITEGNLLNFHLLEWLTANYGENATQRLLVSNLEKLSLEEQNEALLRLLHWFREEFPYYHDQCGQCGASYRAECIDRNAASNNENDDDDDDDNSRDDIASVDEISAMDGNEVTNDPTSYEGSFLGYCYPEANELEGKAARTEIYQCNSCNCNTRFPRYNAVQQIVENGGRGRCGEYSILLYRILRSLGHEARWVVDWADHVWAECRIGGRWVHLDPCEAALDHPLLYEEWGKKQTYIIAFWTPLGLKMGDASTKVFNQEGCVLPYPLIEDVTLQYTTDGNATLSQRREMKEDSIESIISRAAHQLLEMMKDIDL
jgi:hypothetical protein